MPDHWKKEVTHVECLLQSYWAKQGVQDTREFIINVNDDDSSSADISHESDFEAMSGNEELDSDL